ncbi:MAG: hypothetical protein O7C59_04780 [Rickettsia endosymbiont of Ixodes persulcatus]|nr:hypothetical protein [Rickettsia endosymbiont of Ixodes persulcatus]MCZ6902035.1 hypothetical protein [Rickettsia endosymbiont of Ixodes persulcatus]MCZ6903908.1 hypothetical protein [Rickettsia endosymbiont of Ixodes persulcatus]MCZ6909045.1 hypothetical protein [Rickettsia endosymbiont of Ixodes persulcatus]MCZ6910970.1 hypothetical protein [Rickettsia endosymbiont of Ixodes persulcatus]
MTRKNFLEKNYINKKMIFYTWYDPMSGNFYFSIVPKDWKKLPQDKEVPLGCIVYRAETIDDIILEFINDKYKGRIPLDELTLVDPSEDDDNDVSNFTLNVYWTDL